MCGGFGRRGLHRRFEGGVDLSGGEWQKIALARAYMRDAQLLILDEPSAALDARAEYEVFARFADLTEGKMALLISHLFSTVRPIEFIAPETAPTCRPPRSIAVVQDTGPLSSTAKLERPIRAMAVTTESTRIA